MRINSHPNYSQKIGLILLILSIIVFIFPQFLQSSLESKELVDIVDYRIRFSALPFGIGIFLLTLSKIQSENIGIKILTCLLIIDLGYFSTRFFSMIIHGFNSSAQLKWLAIEFIIATVILIIMNFKKASPRT
ncbi:MAG: hypothetical protein DWB99_02315 [Candidatus Poseidoniales archaeon]|nr:MAG: hypothetical protein DWB99_02315 [Candidatus Poseidoniales archaeon]